MHWFPIIIHVVALFFAFPVIAAPTVSLEFSRETGTAPFDTNNLPGNDSSPSNNIIRTNDIISYKFEVAISNGDAKNITLRLKTSPGLNIELPAFCMKSNVAPLSLIIGDSLNGYSIICNVGDLREGSQVLYSIPAVVTPEAANRSNIEVFSVSIESDQSAQEVFTGVIDIVSARPMLDLIKNDHTRLMGRRAGPNGEDGVVYVFSIQVATQNQARGNELVIEPISFTDDLSNISPNARLFEGWSGAPTSACAPNYSSHWFRLWHNPYSYVQTAGGGHGGAGSGRLDRSVWNSGSISCTDTKPGGITTITITGADLSGNHYPSEDVVGIAIPANTRFLTSHALAIWIPLTDIQNSGGTLSINNVYSKITARSISGQLNIDPDINNNIRAFIARDGSSGRWFYNHVDHDDYAIIPSTTSRRSGDGYIIPGQIFSTRHYQNNSAWLTKTPLENNIHCTSFDNSKQIITEITPGQGAKVTFDGASEGVQSAPVIEYGTGAFGASATCDDTDSPVGWYTDITLVPGGVGAITKVRASVPSLLAPGGASTVHRMNLITRFTALDNPAGTIVSQFGAFKNDQQNGGNWHLANFDENTALGSYGDRLFLTKAIVRIDKDTIPSSKSQALVGDLLSFRLQPSLTSPSISPRLASNVKVMDRLPEWYQFVQGSANPAISSFTSNSDGTTTLVWEFHKSVVNSPMPAITYDVRVTPTTPDQTSAVNSVVITSPNDGSLESARTDTHSLLVLNPTGFSISKSAVPILVAPDSMFSYALTYANTGTSDFSSIQLIDILPHQSVIRAPSTSFDGIVSFVSVIGNNGEIFEYSKDDPTTIDDDPVATSNQPGGATTWCPAFIGGTCPASASEVTAIRASSPTFLQGQAPRTVMITMQGEANDSFNAYSNRFTAKADGLAFSVTSQTATVLVRTADVRLEKAVSGPDPLNPTLVTFVVTVTNDGPNTAEGLEITDALPSGYVYYSHSGAGNYNPSTGIWLPGNVPVGSSRSFTLQAEVIPGGDYKNTAEVTKQLYSDPDSKPANGDMNEDDMASAYVTRLSGSIFLDNGSGGGIAHNGIQDGSETGGKYGSITLSDTATGINQIIADIAADGSWFAVLASDLPEEFEIEFTPNPTYLLVSENATNLPSPSNSDSRDGRLIFTPNLAAEYKDLDFGVLTNPLLTQDQIVSINSGQTVSLAHRYEASSSGTVVFYITDVISVPTDGFTSNIFSDGNCDGIPEAPVLSAIPIVAGDSVCVVVRTQAGGGLGANAKQVYSLVAKTDFSDIKIVHEVRNDDLLAVGGDNGKFGIRKFVRNISTNALETTVNSGGPGDILEYRLEIINPSTSPAKNVKVSDITPAWTVLSSPIAQSTVLKSGLVCRLLTPSDTLNANGYTGALHWSCPGVFPVGAVGSLKFQVRITP